MIIVIISIIVFLIIKNSTDFNIIDEKAKVKTIPRPNPFVESVENQKNNLENNKPIDEKDKKNENQSIEKTEIKKSEISIKVLNGAGRSGVAAKTKKLLENQGFVVKSIGTARNLYSCTLIYYQESEEKAEMVKKALSGFNPKIEKSSIVGEYDVLVVIGKSQDY